MRQALAVAAAWGALSTGCLPPDGPMEPAKTREGALPGVVHTRRTAAGQSAGYQRVPAPHRLRITRIGGGVSEELAHERYTIPDAAELGILIHQMGSADWREQEIAKWSVKLAGDAALEPLLAELRGPLSPVQLAAVDVLRDLRRPRAVPALLETLAQGNDGIACQAVYALVHIAPTDPAVHAALAQAARAGFPRVRIDALEQLVSLAGTAAAPVALAALRDPLPEIRVGACHALAVVATDENGATGAAVQGLDDPDPSVRGAAAEALGKIGGPAAEAALGVRLASPDPDARYYAIFALSALHAPDGPPAPLIDRLLDACGDPVAMVREAAVMTLWDALDRDSRIGPRIEHLLHDPDEDVRTMAARALRWTGE